MIASVQSQELYMQQKTTPTGWNPIKERVGSTSLYLNIQKTQTRFIVLFLLYFGLFPGAGYASSKTPAKVIAGWVEKISFPEKNVVVKAKLDTGAATSSIHATNIEFFKKNKKRWVRFELVFKGVRDEAVTTIKMERPNIRRVKIKNHDGVYDLRGVVRLDFCFDGRLHEAEFTLTDRSEYIYPILLGREFLEEVAIVDPSQLFRTLKSCPRQENTGSST